jgi:hypothetical protein
MLSIFEDKDSELKEVIIVGLEDNIQPHASQFADGGYGWVYHSA